MKHHIATPYFMPAKHRYLSLSPSLQSPGNTASPASSTLAAHPRAGLLLVLALAGALLGGCSSPRDPLTGKTSESKLNPANWLTPYRVDVIQGNFISKEQVEQLRAGMPRDQVKSVLGTPLVASLFHADRWDYIFTLQRQGVLSQSYRYTVYFKNEVLDRFEGDAMPSESEFVAKLNTRPKPAKVPVLEATEEQLKAADKQPEAVKKTTPAPAPAMPENAAPATYPPLESPVQ